MALSTGAKLGPYEVLSALGAGGMGEVYRARDTRLERTVAIKILNSQLVAGPELRARFEREAKVISQLQHPHICVLHDVGRDGDTDFLVMEYLEGESLSDRLKKGPLPHDDLLKIAIQIADALEKAHRAGVVHRDLKPGNVMLTKSGAKLLDFGLAKPLAAGAKASAGSGASGSVFAAAMTQTSPAPSPATPLSSAGAVIGTVQYMSPEQIQGMEADARSDIFAFGVMLFEMATGKRAFEGKTQASIVGQILAVDPPSIDKLRPESSPALARVIRLCLEKDPDERFQSVHDLKLELQGIAEGSGIESEAPAATPSGRSWPLWAVVGVLAIATIVFAAAYLQTLRTTVGTSVHSYILPPEKTSFILTENHAGPPVVSPDGTRMAFTARTSNGQLMLWVQPLNSPTAQALSGTENAYYPFWSSDSRYIGYFASGKLNKVEANGGPPQALCDASDGRGGAWNAEGTILFAPTATESLMRVDANGGTPSPLTTLGPTETSHRWPAFLPDGKHFIYFVHESQSNQSGIYVGALDSKDRKLLLRNDSNAIYAEPGYLLFVRDNTLMAQRFRPNKLELDGEARPIAANVVVNTDTWRGTMAASANGVLFYQHGEGASGSQLVWYERDGKAVEPLVPDIAIYRNPAISPDGKRVAISIEVAGTGDLWIVDLERKTKTRITFGPQSSDNPVWFPDGKSVAFACGASGSTQGICRKSADGTGNVETLLEAGASIVAPFSMSPDGRYLAYMRNEPKSKTGWDIWALPLFGDRKPFPVVATEFLDAAPSIAPNGKWISYNSNESGRFENYIQPFPSGAGRWQVSTSGGGRTAWRSDGKELYFQSNDGQIMAVDVKDNGGAPQLGTPHALFKTTTVVGSAGPFTASADGKKFLVNVTSVQSTHEPLTLVTNWTADLVK